jgi:sugar phosphate isomerase/epimerase
VRVGVDSYSYHRLYGEIYPNQIDPGRRWQFEQCIEEAVRIGADGISLETCFMPSFEPGYLGRLKDTLDHHGLERMLAWGHPDGLEGGKKPEAAREIEQHLTSCKALGVNLMRIVGSSLSFRNEPHGPQIQRVSAILKETVKKAEDAGVRLALENHIDFTADEILEILANVDSEYLGVNFDSGNTLRVFEDPVEAARKLAKRTYATHMKDIAPGHGSPRDWTFWASAPCGSGIIDMPGVVTALRAAGYRGMLCVEIDFLKDKNADETQAVASAVQYLRTLVNPHP